MVRATSWTALVAFTLAQLVAALPQVQEVLQTTNNDMAYIRRKLVEAEVIPTVIDDFQPSFNLSAAWKSDTAQLGNTLKPSHLSSAPSVHLEKAKSHLDSQFKLTSGMTYVLVLTDPDAPSRDDPKWSQFCHWVAAGVPIYTSENVDFHLEDVLEYKPPGPPPKTGEHRYVFLAFVPANGTTEKLNLTKPKDRKHWGSSQEGYGAREWATKHGLKVVAANFIYAKNEEQ